MRQCRFIGVLVSTLGLILVAGCGSSSSGSGSGTGGSGTSSTGGATGSGGASGGGGASGFTAVNPCSAATDYVPAADNTIVFGGTTFAYAPNCLKVTAGATVTFQGMGGDTFTNHPLAPSAKRGLLTGNPITMIQDPVATKTFTFPTPGFYAYFCMLHDPGDTGSPGFMSGVIWVQ